MEKSNPSREANTKSLGSNVDDKIYWKNGVPYRKDTNAVFFGEPDASTPGLLWGAMWWV